MEDEKRHEPRKNTDQNQILLIRVPSVFIRGKHSSSNRIVIAASIVDPPFLDSHSSVVMNGYPDLFCQEMQAQEVESHLGSATLDFFTGTEPIIGLRADAAFPSQAGEGQADGLPWRAASGSRQT